VFNAFTLLPRVLARAIIFLEDVTRKEELHATEVRNSRIGCLPGSRSG
jgi:hypothetical protein